MKVYVVMGNDYPVAVFAREAEANTCIADRKAVASLAEGSAARVYWRSYEFYMPLAAADEAMAEAVDLLEAMTEEKHLVRDYPSAPDILTQLRAALALVRT